MRLPALPFLEKDQPGNNQDEENRDGYPQNQSLSIHVIPFERQIFLLATTHVCQWMVFVLEGTVG